MLCYEMLRPEYERLRRQIDNRYSEDLAALDRLWRRLQEKPAKPSRRATLDVTRMAVGLMRGADFDVNAVLQKIREVKPETQVTAAAVSVTLQRLAKNPDPDMRQGDSYLELVSAGGPRRAATYRVRREVVE